MVYLLAVSSETLQQPPKGASHTIFKLNLKINQSFVAVPAGANWVHLPPDFI